jgi:hypothetical protein
VRDAEQLGDFGLRKALFDTPQGTEAECLEDFIGQLTSVW